MQSQLLFVQPRTQAPQGRSLGMRLCLFSSPLLMIIYVVQGEAADPDTEQPKNQSEQNEVCITA